MGLSTHRRRGRAHLAAALLLLGTVLLSALPPGAAVAGGRASGATYVALGDSYASGEGLGSILTTPYEDGTDQQAVWNAAGDNTNTDKNRCHRSRKGSYGSLDSSTYQVLPQVPRAQRAFWACSGARAKDMLVAQGDDNVADEYYQHDQPAQVAAVGSRTRWVSLSAGGNDIEFANLIATCLYLQYGRAAVRAPAPVHSSDSVNPPKPGTCSAAITYASTRLDRAGGKAGPLRVTLRHLYRALLDRAPAARLAVVGYPSVLPTSFDRAPVGVQPRLCVMNRLTLPSGLLPQGPAKVTVVGAGFSVSDAKKINSRVVRPLEQTIRAAVAEVRKSPRYADRIAYVDTAAVTKARSCTGKTTKPSVNGLVLSPAGNGIAPTGFGSFVSTASFHPTTTGQQQMGRAVQRTFTVTFATKVAQVVPSPGPAG